MSVSGAAALVLAGVFSAFASPADVLDREALAELEGRGFSLASVLSGQELPAEGRLSTLGPIWASLSEVLAADIQAVIAGVERPLVWPRPEWASARRPISCSSSGWTDIRCPEEPSTDPRRVAVPYVQDISLMHPDSPKEQRA